MGSSSESARTESDTQTLTSSPGGQATPARSGRLSTAATGVVSVIASRRDLIHGIILMLMGVVAIAEILLTPGSQFVATVVSSIVVGFGLNMVLYGRDRV